MSTTQTSTDIKALQEKAEILREQKQQLETTRAILNEKLRELTEKLEQALGTNDWDKAEQVLDRLETEAQEALQSLTEAFKLVGD